MASSVVVVRYRGEILFAISLFLGSFGSWYAGWSVRSDVVQILQRILRRAQVGARVGELARDLLGRSNDSSGIFIRSRDFLGANSLGQVEQWMEEECVRGRRSCVS